MLCLLARTLPIGLALCLGQTQAAPLSYDEALQGDIVAPVFAFDVGINRVSGRTRNVVEYTDDAVTGFDIDVDTFRFSIPDGTALRSGRIDAEFIDLTSNTIVSFENRWSLVLGDGSPVTSACRTFVGTPAGCDGSFTGGEFFSRSDLTGKHYLMGNPESTGWTAVQLTRTNGGEVLYTLSFDVQRVGEPLSLALALLGLGAALVVQRRNPTSSNSASAFP